jgi:cation diffusion facilitator family transporter
MMVAEIAAGIAFGSMALIADGLHMSTHAAALAIAALAYLFARRHAHDPRFTFGTGKLGELAGFASAVILGIIAILIGIECLLRLWTPVPISFNQAIGVAFVGLAVNLASAWLLRHDHEHSHAHAHGEDHHHHADHNLRSAYAHVLADALTSILAIIGLLIARFQGWLWIDPAIGIVGAIIIAAWAWRLIRASGAVLLDTVPDSNLAVLIRERLEARGDRVTDLHLWRVGPGHSALIAAVVSDHPEPANSYKALLDGIAGLSHVTVEVHERRPRVAA